MKFVKSTFFFSNEMSLVFPIPENIRGMGTSSRHNDLWDRFGRQALLMIG